MMKVLSTGWYTFHETGKYTCATVEYAGLFSFSVVRKGGGIVTSGVRTVTRPVAKAVTWPFETAWNKASGIFSGKNQFEKITGLEKKLTELEQRLVKIEKHGVLPASAEFELQEKKSLSEDKRFFLKQVLQETKSLKEEE